MTMTMAWRARVPEALRATKLPLPAPALASAACRPPLHTAAYWTATMRDQDFREEDRLDTARFNRELARGLSGHRDCSERRLAARQTSSFR
jgi:hypothetical protein